MTEEKKPMFEDAKELQAALVDYAQQALDATVRYDAATGRAFRLGDSLGEAQRALFRGRARERFAQIAGALWMEHELEIETLTKERDEARRELTALHYHARRSGWDGKDGAVDAARHLAQRWQAAILAGVVVGRARPDGMPLDITHAVEEAVRAIGAEGSVYGPDEIIARCDVKRHVFDRVAELEAQIRTVTTERDEACGQLEAIKRLHPLLEDAPDKSPSLVPRVRAIAQCYRDARATEECAIGKSRGYERGAAWLRAEVEVVAKERDEARLTAALLPVAVRVAMETVDGAAAGSTSSWSPSDDEVANIIARVTGRSS